MRRIVIIGAALSVLLGGSAAGAVAYFNSYSGSKFVLPGVAGTEADPRPIGETEVLKADATHSGERAAPLIDIKTTVYGVVASGGQLPKCTNPMIEKSTNLYDKACPEGSMVADGPVRALLGPSNDPSAGKATACNPFLHVYNGGRNTVVFFFITGAQHQCAGLRTGATAPFDGHISYHGKNMVVNVPLPPDISNKAANQPGLFGSLISEKLTWFKITRKVHGKTVAALAVVACDHGQRPWKIQVTAQDYNGAHETRTVSGHAKC